MAVTLTDVKLQAAIGTNLEVATRLLTVCTEVVERYAPDAPEAIQNEACIRVAAWLWQSSASGVVEVKRGERAFMHYRPSLTGALRSSGAMSLLRPYKPVGVGICEAT